MPSIRSNFSGVVVVQVEAPCDVVFETLCDVDKYASIYPHILSVEVLNNVEIPQVGSKWKETRMFRGQQVEMIRAVREFSENPMTVKIDNSFENPHRWDTRRSNESITLILEPMEEEPKHCRMILTFGYVADGIVAFVMTRVFGYCIKRYGNRYMQEELELFAAEAEKRYRESRAAGK